MIAATLLIVLTTPTAPAEDRFPGTWTNLDKQSDGLTKLVVTEKDGKCTIQAWGAGAEGDIDQGTVTLHLCSDSIRGTTKKYGFATWEHKHATQHLTLYVADGGLTAEHFTIFTDKSGRSNVRLKYEFEKGK
jgi:hypothetical protein